MLNSHYFQPMQHKPLPDIRKYDLLDIYPGEFMTLAKPTGIDVYIQRGKIYDFNHNELKNQSLLFHFEKLLQTSINLQVVVIGILICDVVAGMLAHRYSLYSPNKLFFEGTKILVYDLTFPVFNIDHDYKWRYDILEKTIGILPNCETLKITITKGSIDLRNFVRDTFELNVSSEILVYRTDGKYIQGASQLYWENVDHVSFSVKATQLYRGHIKKIVSTTEQHSNGDKTELALYIIARFKKEYINIPIHSNNFALRSYLWNYRSRLKSFPFWFTGYTYLDDVVGTLDYVTVVNEFVAFIPTQDACN